MWYTALTYIISRILIRKQSIYRHTDDKLIRYIRMMQLAALGLTLMYIISYILINSTFPVQNTICKVPTQWCGVIGKALHQWLLAITFS